MVCNNNGKAVVMVMNKRNIFLFLILMILALLSLFSAACEPIAPLRIRNETDQTLSIFVKFGAIEQFYKMGNVEPGEEIKNENSRILRSDVYYIEAKSIQGEIIYSKKYSYVYLIEELDWKIVIPPIEGE